MLLDRYLVGATENNTLSEQEYNRTLGVLRLVAVFALIAGLLYFAEPSPIGVTVGFLFAAAGEAVRFWAAGHLLKTKELITSGPYRFTRNPLYLGRLLIFTGLALMTLCISLFQSPPPPIDASSSDGENDPLPRRKAYRR